jgi:hypothetical protein
MNERQKDERVEGGVARTLSGFEGTQAVYPSGKGPLGES